MWKKPVVLVTASLSFFHTKLIMLFSLCPSLQLILYIERFCFDLWPALSIGCMHKKLMSLSCQFCRPSLCFFRIVYMWEQEHPKLGWTSCFRTGILKETPAIDAATFYFHHSVNRRQERVFKLQNQNLARRKKASSGTRHLSQAKWCKSNGQDANVT